MEWDRTIEMEKNEFYQSKKRRLFGLIIPIIALAICTYILLFFKNNKIEVELYIFIIAIVLMVAFNIKKKPTVTIGSLGVTVRVNRIGLVKWEHIDDFKIQKMVNGEAIIFDIKDHEKLLHEKSRVISALMRTNIKKIGSPVCIPKQEFDLPLIEVLRIFIDFKINQENSKYM